MFQLKAVECYQPAGNNIFCTCYTEIEVGSCNSDTAAVAKSTSEEQGGLWWSRKTKANKRPSAKKKTTQRRQVTCPNADCGVSFSDGILIIQAYYVIQKAYCVECKSFWHDGDCIEQTGPSKDDVCFTITCYILP